MFEIKSEEAKVINESAVAVAGETAVNHNNTMIFLGMGVIIAALVIIIVLLLKKKREETNENDEHKISSS
ncbi:LPXTG cell wall anchor domain-containing protein [Paenibacillus thiaminolyticus]|nr:LPXTG cell wall anchor domain-containing protein [Paenibacillus thiaminolyticus]WCR26419.1 LPXTG cell wall anchor domain-containing protein [Paenibacillus thiaminolyticus]